MLVAPGAVTFGVLLLVAVAVSSLNVWYILILVTREFGLLPISFALTLLSVTCWQWRRHWISGLSVLAASLCVCALFVLPPPFSAPLRWAANVARVCYYRDELERSYLHAKARGDQVPVGQIYLEGFGSMTAGLAYDPSGELSRPFGKRSATWMSGPGETELGLENLEVHQVFGRYYQWYHD